MPISFSCTSCSKTYNVKEAFVGRSFKCKQCGEVVQVPGGTRAPVNAGRSPASRTGRRRSSGATSEFESASRVQRRPVRQTKRRKKASSGAAPYLLFGGLALGVLLLIGVIGGAIMMLDNDPDEGAGDSIASVADDIRKEEAVRKSNTLKDVSETLASRPPASRSSSAEESKSESPSASTTTSTDEKEETVLLQFGRGSSPGAANDWSVKIEVPDELRQSDQFAIQPVSFKKPISEVQTCSTYSPFILVKNLLLSSSERGKQIVNIETGEVVGEISIESSSLANVSFTPDGKWLLERGYVRDGQSPSKGKLSSRPGNASRSRARNKQNRRVELRIYSMESGEQVTAFEPFNDKRLSVFSEIIDANTVLVADFPDRSGDPDGFQHFRSKGYKVKRSGLFEYVEVPWSEQKKFYDSLPDYPEPKLMAIDIHTQEKKWIEVLPNGYVSLLASDGPRFTPDRRYLVLDNKKNFIFFEIENQSVAGVITPDSEIDYKALSIEMWDFSPDGKRFALLLDNGKPLSDKRSIFQVYDTVSGNLLHEVEVPEGAGEDGRLLKVEGEDLWLVANRFLIDTKTNSIVLDFNLTQRGMRFSFRSYLNKNRMSAFINDDNFIYVDKLNSANQSIIHRWPILNSGIRSALNAYRNDEPAILKKGMDMAVHVEFMDPDVLPDEGAIQIIQGVLEQKVKDSGYNLVDDAEYRLALYYGSEVTKPAYEKNKDVIVRSPGEMLSKSNYGIQRSNPNIILGVEDRSGRMVWGEAMEVPVALMRTRVGDLNPQEEKLPELNFDAKSDKAAVEKSAVARMTNHQKARRLRTSLLMELSVMRVPDFIPQDRSLMSLPATLTYEIAE